MPIYEYACAKCGKCFEAIRFASDTEPPACPACGSTKVDRHLSCFALGAGSGGASGLSDLGPAPSGGGGCGSGGFS